MQCAEIFTQHAKIYTYWQRHCLDNAGMQAGFKWNGHFTFIALV